MEHLQKLSGGFMETATKCTFGSIPNWYIAVGGVVLLVLVGGFVAYRFYFAGSSPTPAKEVHEMHPQQMLPPSPQMRMPMPSPAAEMPPPPRPQQAPTEEFDDDQYQQNLNSGAESSSHNQEQE